MSRLRAPAAATVLALVALLVPTMEPASALEARNERVYVANAGSDTVSVIDVDTHAVIATIPVGDRPTAVGFIGTRVYVTNYLSGTVSVIDIASNAVVATVPVGIRPAGLDFTAYYGELWVTNEGSNNVSVIDLYTNTVVDTVPVGIAPHGITFSPHGEEAYVTSQSDTVTVVDDHDGHRILATVPVGHTPTDIEAPLWFGPKIYVSNQSSNTVSVINRDSDTVVKTIPVGTDPTGMLQTPFSKLYVANKGSSTISVIDMATDTVVDTWPAVHPHELAASALNADYLYATGMGVSGGVVTVLDFTTGALVATVPVGDFPEGIAVAPVPPPVIAGQTWYSSGAKASSGPAGSTVSLYAVGALQGVPYQLTLSLPGDWPCFYRMAILNPTPVVSGPNGVIGRVRGTIPPDTPAGNYTICFRHTGGVTATGAATLTVV